MIDLDELSLTLSERYRVEVDRLCVIAFSADCRLAISFKPELMIGDVLEGKIWDHVILGPGEFPPNNDRLWTIYENHSGIAVGRSAR